MNPENQKVPISKIILTLLAQTGQTAIDYYNFFADLKFNRGYYLRGGHDLVVKMKKLQEEKLIKVTLKNLQRSNYIKAKKIGQRLTIFLTKKGLASTLAIRLKQSPTSKHKLATVVIFDIPQSQNAARRQFRLLLRQGGFTKLQQSVWASQRDNYNLVIEFVKQTKLTPWVNVFHANNFLTPPQYK